MPCNYNPITGNVETLHERHAREAARDAEMMANYDAKLVSVAQEVDLHPRDLHCAASSLLHMDTNAPGFRNMIRDIGAAGFANSESIGDIKRVILGYLVSH